MLTLSSINRRKDVFSFIPLRQKKSVRGTVNIHVHKYVLAAVRREILIFFSSIVQFAYSFLHADEMWIERSLSPRLFPLLLFLRMLVVCR